MTNDYITSTTYITTNIDITTNNDITKLTTDIVSTCAVNKYIAYLVKIQTQRNKFNNFKYARQVYLGKSYDYFKLVHP